VPNGAAADVPLQRSLVPAVGYVTWRDASRYRVEALLDAEARAADVLRVMR
jgi:hypothetical protein